VQVRVCNGVLNLLTVVTNCIVGRVKVLLWKTMKIGE